jgi:uncharacterized RDD family membrane protein YckC
MTAISFDKPRIHKILTPEGISLPFVVAAAGDRVGAFFLDSLVIVLMTIVLWLGALAVASVGLEELGTAVALIVHFLLWNFYFIWFETRWSGATYAKRRLGLRVISRDGGPLTAEAIFARNLMRNLELYLPAAVLLSPEALLPEAPGWGRLLAAAWILVFAFMPLFNQDRLRCGDLVAGTIVVRAPKAMLLSDLAERSVRPAPRRAAPGGPPPPPAEAFPFTREQLDIYGIHELQVLEDLLRRDDEGTLDPRVLAEVCEKIKTKISWPADSWNVPVRPFLDSFYRAQRRLLEQKMLFGQRRERKRG